MKNIYHEKIDIIYKKNKKMTKSHLIITEQVLNTLFLCFINFNFLNCLKTSLSEVLVNK